MSSEVEKALSTIRLIPDYPIEGVLFRDITTLLAQPEALSIVIKAALETETSFTHIAGLEARGFILGAVMAHQAHCAFIPIRKAGKLPYTTHRRDYGLEYGDDAVEVHVDAAGENDVVLLVDDVLATGGTIIAALELLQDLSTQCREIVVLLEIESLGGRQKISEKFPEVIIRSLQKV